MGYVLMVKRRKEEEIAGVLEFAGRTAEDPNSARGLPSTERCA